MPNSKDRQPIKTLDKKTLWAVLCAFCAESAAITEILVKHGFRCSHGICRACEVRSNKIERMAYGERQAAYSEWEHERKNPDPKKVREFLAPHGIEA